MKVAKLEPNSLHKDLSGFSAQARGQQLGSMGCPETRALEGDTVLKNGFWVAATTEIASLKPLTILTF